MLTNTLTMANAFVCKRCGHESSTKSNLLKHLRRKNPCNPLNDVISVDDYIKDLLGTKQYNEKTYSCCFCDTPFNSRQSMYRHKKTCKKADEGNVEDITILKQTIAAMDERIKELEKNKQLSINTPGSSNQINSNNTVNNIQINVKNFGYEEQSYLDNEFLSKCFATKDIVGLIESIHCDKQHKENYNVRIRSLKRNLMETVVDGKWIVTRSDDTLTNLIQNGYRVLRPHGYKNKDKIIKDELDDNENEYYNIVDWLEHIYDNDNAQRPIKQKLLLLFLSNRALLLGKDSDD